MDKSRIACLVSCLSVLAIGTIAAKDVVVVGGGLAGLSASIEAALNGARVTIIEKQSALGGNSAKATSGINGAKTVVQEELGIRDDSTLLEKDTISSGDGLSNSVLVKKLASQSNDAINFLQSFDIALDDVVQLGGHSVARTHRFLPTKDGRPIPVGFTVISKLRKYIDTVLGSQIKVLLNGKFIGLIFEAKKVVGIKYMMPDGVIKEIFGDVILAAGGFAHGEDSDSILAKYASHAYEFPTTNGPWATGDIIKATLNDNLSLIHMDKVQIHPTSFLDPLKPNSRTNFLAPESLRGSGGILINHEGRRFANELGRRDYVTNLMLKKCYNFKSNPSYPIVCVLLLNNEVVNKFGHAMLNFYKSKGLIQDVGSLKDVSFAMNISLEILQQTIADYKKASLQGIDEFGKSSYPVLFNLEDHFYISYVTPAVHYCMGGIEINEKSQVLSSIDHLPVGGLFAAGEVTGGVHGQNRLGGNSLLECVVFGRIAGRGASNFNQDMEQFQEKRDFDGLTRVMLLTFFTAFVVCLMTCYKRRTKFKCKLNLKSV